MPFAHDDKLRRLIVALLALFSACASVAAEPGPRIEVTSARWTRPAELAFVNAAMRCVFAGTNENTQLQSIRLLTPDGSELPVIARAGPLVERHPDPDESFARLPDGFVMERRLPVAAARAAPGAFLRSGARLRLTGDRAELVMQEEIRFLRPGKQSFECFSVDAFPCRPLRLHWQQDGGVGGTNLVADGLLRVPTGALAVAGSNGVVVIRLAMTGAASADAMRSEALVRHDARGTRCSFGLACDQAVTSTPAVVQLDLRLLPPGATPDEIRGALAAEVQP